MSLQIVILAAGQGKRMVSKKPKVLHEIAGKPMLSHLVDTAEQLHPDHIFVVIGHEGEAVQSALPHLKVHWVQQAQQLGTGHALLQVLPHLKADANVLVLYGDIPLISKATLEALLALGTGDNGLNLIVSLFENPTGLGRIKRDAAHHVVGIIEEKDASEAERSIQEIFAGMCYTSVQTLSEWLPQLSNHNAQGEFYLTDLIGMAVQEKRPVRTLTADPLEVSGVNSRLQLQHLERAWQRKQAHALMQQGITIADESRIDIRGELVAESDVTIDIDVIFEGKVSIGTGSKIGPFCTLKNVTIGNNCIIHAHSVLEGSVLEDSATVGPFARLRTGTVVKSHAKVGNFVEVKATVIGERSKANHLSYLGDARIGKDVNVGAGTITCNYDGANKHVTIIEDGVHIGSDTQLVAPITVGKNATIGAGSTLRKDAPPEALTLSVSAQKTVTTWKRPKKGE